MKTDAIRTCIQRCHSYGMGIRGAEEGLAAMEAEIEATKQGGCGHNYDRREWDACPVCAMKNGVSVRIYNIEAENAALREVLAFQYSGAALYGDDGELQDNRVPPFIDFKRDSVDYICQAMRQRGIDVMEKEGSDEGSATV